MTLNCSPRERQIVMLVGRDGRSYKATARELGISVRTVQTYVERILSKHDVDRVGREGIVVMYYRSLVGSGADGPAPDGDRTD